MRKATTEGYYWTGTYPSRGLQKSIEPLEQLSAQVVAFPEPRVAFQVKELVEKRFEGFSIQNSLSTKHEDDNSEEWEEVMAERGLNIPEDIEQYIEDPQLNSKMVQSEDFLASIVKTIRRVESLIGPNDAISAYIEGDERTFKKNRIEVLLALEDDTDNVDEWLEKENQIQQAARDAESEGEMIYTYVDRKPSSADS